MKRGEPGPHSHLTQARHCTRGACGVTASPIDRTSIPPMPPSDNRVFCFAKVPCRLLGESPELPGRKPGLMPPSPSPSQLAEL